MLGQAAQSSASKSGTDDGTAKKKKSKNFSPLMIKFRKDEEQKEEYQDTIFKQCQYLNTPLQYGEFLETWDLFIFCIKYYNGWYAWYLVFL